MDADSKSAGLRLSGSLVLATAPYVLHVLPLGFGGDVLFHSLAGAFAAFAACGALSGLVCGGWSVPCGFLALAPAYAVLRAASFLEPRDGVPFLIFGTVAAAAFGLAAVAVSAIVAAIRARRASADGS